MRMPLLSILLLCLAGCESKPQVVINKTVVEVETVSDTVLAFIEEERRQYGSPAELLDPFYTRLQYYLKVEAEINQLYDEIEPFIENATSRPKLEIKPVKGFISGAKYQVRGKEIVHEFILNRVEFYRYFYAKELSNSKVTWWLKPTIMFEQDKMFLSIEVFDESNKPLPYLRSRVELTDYFFFHYVDGLRYKN